MEQWRNVRPRLSPIINEMFFILIVIVIRGYLRLPKLPGSNIWKWIVTCYSHFLSNNNGNDGRIIFFFLSIRNLVSFTISLNYISIRTISKLFTKKEYIYIYFVFNLNSIKIRNIKRKKGKKKNSKRESVCTLKLPFHHGMKG